MFRDVEFLSTFCDPVTVIAVAATLTPAPAGTPRARDKLGSQAAPAHAQDRENQQRDALKASSDAAAQQAAAQAVTGQTFGEDPTAKAAATGLGFQATGTGAGGGAGRAALTGMN